MLACWRFCLSHLQRPAHCLNVWELLPVIVQKEHINQLLYKYKLRCALIHTGKSLAEDGLWQKTTLRSGCCKASHLCLELFRILCFALLSPMNERSTAHSPHWFACNDVMRVQWPLQLDFAKLNFRTIKGQTSRHVTKPCRRVCSEVHQCLLTQTSNLSSVAVGLHRRQRNLCQANKGKCVVSLRGSVDLWNSVFDEQEVKFKETLLFALDRILACRKLPPLVPRIPAETKEIDSKILGCSFTVVFLRPCSQTAAPVIGPSTKSRGLFIPSVYHSSPLMMPGFEKMFFFQGTLSPCSLGHVEAPMGLWRPSRTLCP